MSQLSLSMSLTSCFFVSVRGNTDRASLLLPDRSVRGIMPYINFWMIYLP